MDHIVRVTCDWSYPWFDPQCQQKFFCCKSSKRPKATKKFQITNFGKMLGPH